MCHEAPSVKKSTLSPILHSSIISEEGRTEISITLFFREIFSTFTALKFGLFLDRTSNKCLSVFIHFGMFFRKILYDCVAYFFAGSRVSEVWEMFFRFLLWSFAISKLWSSQKVQGRPEFMASCLLNSQFSSMMFGKRGIVVSEEEAPPESEDISNPAPAWCSIELQYYGAALQH